jgi:hypothetical protein
MGRVPQWDRSSFQSFSCCFLTPLGEGVLPRSGRAPVELVCDTGVYVGYLERDFSSFFVVSYSPLLLVVWTCGWTCGTLFRLSFVVALDFIGS